MASAITFERTSESPEEQQLRIDVREFLAKELPKGITKPSLGMAASHDPEFSRKLAAQGWVGMALPREYGGHSRTAVDRFIVVEELLSHGAPVGAHWVADRQSGQSILKFGTEAQKQEFLPKIAAGECFFSIGMSEPNSGSDLASVSTRAVRGENGWIVNGTKIWTSGAHQNDYFIVLCRTSALEDDKHHGLSQFLVDLSLPGLSINPITFLDGRHDFNEVVFEDVFVPDEYVMGEVGMGWAQVNSELAYERAGPDRYLSTYQVVENFVREKVDGSPSPKVAEALGRLIARYWALRQMSFTISRMIDEGRAPAVQASIVKDMGTVFEQEVIEIIRTVIDEEPSLETDSLFENLLAQSILTGPSFTIRGGTTEVLRTITSRGLAGRA